MQLHNHFSLEVMGLGRGRQLSLQYNMVYPMPDVVMWKNEGNSKRILQ